MKEEKIEPRVKNIPEEIIIPEQQSIEQSTENKEIGLSMTPFVLRNVYVPEFIIVHLGTPISSAENVTVRFIDYIKNVASSEILVGLEKELKMQLKYFKEYLI